MSDHALQRYTTHTTTDGKMFSSESCSWFFRKCYTVLYKSVSWDIAQTECLNENKHLVTIASKKEMNYVQYLLRSLLYMQKIGADERKLHGAHIGLRRVKDRQMRMNFIWVNNNNVTFSDWKRRQPSTGDCTRTSFEYFNTEENWETEDCYNNLVEFYICENTFLVNTTKRDIMEQDVCKMFVKKDLLTSPYSGKTCQNWLYLSDNAKSDFDNNFSSLRDTLENTTVCKDPSGQGVLWCFVSNFDKPVREPCFLHLEDNLSMPEKRVPETKCADGSSIPKINWCDRTFDCIDFTDELSCQNRLKDHDLAIIGKAMMQSNLPKRLKPEAYFTCEHSKEWISTLAKCDNVIDCLDASDEVNCFNGCDDNEFSCDGGHCIKFSHVCDFISDCADGTDEKCDFQKCDENEFRCNNEQCIPSENRCNSKPDCLDKSDEENCESCTNSFLCSGDYKCIPLRLTCDLYPDCTDSSDELTCRSKIPTSADLRNEYVSLVDSKGEQNSYIKLLCTQNHLIFVFCFCCLESAQNIEDKSMNKLHSIFYNGI
ncbi:low-density lipoprotein receptor-related protein 2-like isoform X2 [Ruditapes philippinarum]|uniref:low-density lipoprotein receptor-related protein 2-like isoform X2 n=1 Tax=Ruditapes philippinarum TaxID=129788 RepID=UPI00295AE7E8|nr:low-density lipoprotein receptor-related protein 2-like isoform X2 [Ruditapes philippinarum]